MAAHTLLSFSAWDRYLLGLAPVVAVFLARLLLLPLDGCPSAATGPRRARVYPLLLALFLAVTLVPPVQSALRGDLPVGSDHGQYEDIDRVAAYLRANAAPDAAIFHHLLGWHFSYYLFGERYSYHYYPDAADLLDQARRLPPEREKYIAFPDWVATGELEATLQAGGWRLREVYRTYGADGRLTFTVHRLEPLPR